MSEKFNRLNTIRNNSLDACGIGHDVQQRFTDGQALIAAMAAYFVERASSQLAHNLLTNAPCEIDIGEDAGRHAVRHGIVSCASKFAEWGIDDIRALCGDILEDCNDHEEARIMREKSANIIA